MLGGVGALLTAGVEVVLLAAVVPMSTSDSIGLVHFGLTCWLLYGLTSVPLAMLAAVFEARVPRFATADLIAIAAGLVGTGLVVRAVLASFARVKGEFPTEIELSEQAALVGGVAGVALLCLWVVRPLLASLCEALPWLDRPAPLAAVLSLLGAGTCLFAAYFALEPLHLGLAALPAGIAALGLHALFARALGLGGGKRLARAWLALLALLAIAGAGPWAPPHSRFLLFAHASAAGALAGRVRDLADFDGDLSGPTFLLGNDCAPFDRHIRPMRWDAPGDGIDQDCSGGDAPTGTPLRTPDRTPRCAPEVRDLSLLMITIDAMRADALDRRITPAMTHFAERSLRFTRAYAPAGYTHHSTLALSTGQFVSDLLPRLSASRVPLGRTLAKYAGDASVPSALFGDPSFSDVFRRSFSAVNPGGDDVPTNTSRGFRSANVTQKLLAWIDAHRNGRFFAWAHFIDPHAPYLPLPTLSERSAYLTPYHRELEYVDFHFAEIARKLSEWGLLERTVVVLTADHGEDLGLRGHQGHGVDAYEDTAHVPLAIWVPSCAPERIDTPVGLVQVAPTLRALLGFARGRGELLARDPTPALPVVSEAYSDELLFDDARYKRAIVRGDHKLIHDVRNGGYALFDLRIDPLETTNLAGSRPALFAEMRAEYQRFLDRGLRANER